MIYTFGDSFANGDCIRENVGISVEKGYQEFLAEQLNTASKKIAISGCSNYDILNLLTTRSHEYKSGDILIVLMSTVDRENHPVTNKGLGAKLLGDLTLTYEERDHKLPFLLGLPLYSSGLQYMHGKKERETAIRSYIRVKYIENLEGKEREDAINTLIHHTINSRWGMEEHYKNYFYTWFKNLDIHFKQRGITYKVYPSDWWRYIKDIEEESTYTKPACDCGHWNEDGHKIFSEYIYKHIKEDVRTILHNIPGKDT